ncbi:MAG: allantoinase AllB [Verrucomicrobiota bacterium]|jgi:allantoinase
MSDHDLLVHGTNGSLAISDGFITAAGPSLSGTAREEINFRDALILPGWIDAHVHFNEPGRADWEGFATGSRALAAGGGTTFFDMPLNSSPPVINRAAFEEKRRIGENISCLDFALWGGLTPDSLDHLEAMADAGAIGFKAFMCPSGIDEFQSATPSTLRQGMEIAAGLDLPVAVHAEDPEVIHLHQLAHPATATDMRAWLDSRPIEAELSAIRIALDLAGETGCQLHIVHVTCPEGIELVTAAKQLGVRVTVETCPHYLLLDDNTAIAIGPAAKCAPPLRSAPTVTALWQQLLAGNIDTIGSDHSPSPPDLKQGTDIFAMWGGIAGIQHALPLLLSRNLNHLPKLSTNVAATFRLPEKVSLTPGHHADFIVLTENPFTITREQLLTRHAISPYLGLTASHTIAATYLRGQKVTPESHGKFLAPQRS